jgi:DNA-binding NtrC family response regulator
MTIHRVTNAAEREHASVPSRLYVLSGENAGMEVSIPPVGVVVGADDACAVKLIDARVSRKHVSIVPGEAGFRVKDMGSRNGTWVDGAQITEGEVPVGAILRVGSTLLQLLPAEEAGPLPASARTQFGALRGQSDGMRRVFSVLERASKSNAPVLVLGESGTGKELVARALHDEGSRKGGPFVVFDCGAASDSLIESELFGHKKGSFTGAQADRLGAFAAAHKGTLFLDEIGDLPLSLQPKLLRMLERGEVIPVGSNKAEQYDVRIVAATHKDLWGEVGRGTFRGDLYFRLSVVEVHMPALRQRPEDIPLLVRAFLEANGASSQNVEGRSLERLTSYAWPGNVRELRNVIARSVALAAPGATFPEMPVLLKLRKPSDATTAPAAAIARLDAPYHEAKEELLLKFDREYCAKLLERAQGNLSQAARLAGLDRKHLYRVLERAGLGGDRGQSSGDDGEG